MAKRLLSLSWDRATGFLKLTAEGGWLKPAARDRLEKELIPHYEKLVLLDGKEVKIPVRLQNSECPAKFRVRVLRRKEDSPRCPTVMLIHDGNRTPGKAPPRGVAPEWAEQLLKELDDLVPAWMYDGVSRQEATGLQSTIDHLRRSLSDHPRRAGEMLLLGYLTWMKAPSVSQYISQQWDEIMEILAARVQRESGRSRKEKPPGHLPFPQP
jgi:hypothetical protein